MDARLIIYGEKFGVLNSLIGNLDDKLVWMEMNQEQYIRDFYTSYSMSLSGYHFVSDLDVPP